MDPTAAKKLKHWLGRHGWGRLTQEPTPVVYVKRSMVEPTRGDQAAQAVLESRVLGLFLLLHAQLAQQLVLDLGRLVGIEVIRTRERRELAGKACAVALMATTADGVAAGTFFHGEGKRIECITCATAASVTETKSRA